MLQSFYQYSFPQLQELCREHGLPPESAGLLFNWHYKQRQIVPCQHHNLARKAQLFARDYFDFSLPTVARVHESADKTVKFLVEFGDHAQVETVLIPFQNKYTLCLSSQVGCAMNCSFCFTARMGLQRTLRTEEIIGQFLVAQRWLSATRPDDDRILNIVYMGQGEPLHNFDAVKTSAQIFLAQHGLSLAGHKITVSTSGYLPGLERWKGEMPDVNIALSLHSPIPAKRERLIPIQRKYPLEVILPIVQAIPTGKKRFVTYEYLLIQDLNDSEADARATGELLQGQKAFINLIPFNPYPGANYARPTESVVRRFKSVLDEYKIPTLIRTTKGDEILAACGQLNTALH